MKHHKGARRPRALLARRKQFWSNHKSWHSTFTRKELFIIPINSLWICSFSLWCLHNVERILLHHNLTSYLLYKCHTHKLCFSLFNIQTITVHKGVFFSKQSTCWLLDGEHARRIQQSYLIYATKPMLKSYLGSVCPPRLALGWTRTL